MITLIHPQLELECFGTLHFGHGHNDGVGGGAHQLNFRSSPKVVPDMVENHLIILSSSVSRDSRPPPKKERKGK